MNTISQQPLVTIQYNFTRMIDTKPTCAYCQRVAFIIPRFFEEKKGGSGLLISVCPSVRLSVCLSHFVSVQ